MAKPFDPKLKQEIITAVKSGSITQAEACRLYGVRAASFDLAFAYHDRNRNRVFLQ
jgi:transposase-like protein